MGVRTIKAGIYGLLLPDTFGIILGRCSSFLKGLHIFPGVIDNAFQGEIIILASSPDALTIIDVGQRIAQLLLLPFQSNSHKSLKS